MNHLVVIGGLISTSTTVVIPMILAKYEGLPLRLVSGYPGTNELSLALERGEIDGVFSDASTLHPDLISSREIVPILQVYPIRPDLPTIDSVIRSEQERALLHLALASINIGQPLLGPPGLPKEVTSALRSAYSEMVDTDEYRAAAAMRSIDVSIPNSGEALQRYVTTNLNLAAIPPDTLTEYISILGNN